ncbi:DUF3298 and DUF4163 domain-containing protein [Desulforamulus aeronauticus]|uniref:DUF3298 domain-containing protein n=1 Tax=Desulforamulus aeronauticus DSM 10349 TaxID=1121421 RepID=A0A1M6U1P5_9FIRM|nr:DUF3298 and DUF4163 domain-containing protein [Desulforamulus aeronauticus]SHK63073.1 Protein of unknown function [Desulforamulus aeronauticus DSM 10349]
MVSKNNHTAIITDEKLVDQCTDITYPQVSGLTNKTVQADINRLINAQVNKILPKDNCQTSTFGKYEVKLNEQGLLSIVLYFYTIREQAANGLNIQKSITVDLATGKVYELHDLFKPGSRYKMVLDKMIRQQIQEQGLTLIKEFTGITDNQDFYLTKDALVIYFQELAYTIHADGTPEFVIPYQKIDQLIRQDGPIARLLEKS